MSFKVAISDVLIANEALSMLPAGSIASMAENSPEAEACRRLYKPVVAEMLELHHWGLATKRVALASIANDRAGEWGFAYAKPADMAFPVKVGGPGGYWSGWTYGAGVYSLFGRPLFCQVGGTIYSVVSMATLEYTSFSITEADFTNLFKRAVTLELAARICAPITKNAERQKGLMLLAEAERQRYIANDLNRSQPSYGTTPTESEIVRGVGDWMGWEAGAYPLDPVANPAVTGY